MDILGFQGTAFFRQRSQVDIISKGEAGHQVYVVCDGERVGIRFKYGKQDRVIVCWLAENFAGSCHKDIWECEQKWFIIYSIGERISVLVWIEIGVRCVMQQAN